jgi:hypothetical protein
MTPAAAPASWLLLVHQLPPRPLYLRAKIRQRLAKVGAVALKNAVYVLPDTEDAREDFTWIAQEARAGGGDAFVCAATFVEGVSPTDLVARFRREREADYEALLADLRSASRGSKSRAGGSPGDPAATIARSAKRLDEIRALDFFGADRRKEAEAMIRTRERELHREAGPSSPAGRYGKLTGRVWVTRRGVKVDRIASAWFVRRFVDPSARFRFVDPAADTARPGELRFDMAGGEFTHEGDRCTFETLLARVGLKDAALGPIAEIVHDIDLKDGKYSRADAAGVRQLLEGIVAAHAGDEERLTRGFALFDDLYASFRSPSPPAKGRKRRTKG